MSTIALVSFRLGGTDGVSIEAAKWMGAMRQLGHTAYSVAGEGPVDVLLPGLCIAAAEPPTAAEVESAFAAADIVVVENLCSLPLNPRAAELVAAALRGRRAIFHHHDLPWQRPQFAAHPCPPDDPAWSHVTINKLSREQLAMHAVEAVTIYNAFDCDPPRGTRQDVGTLVVLQPTRAIPRKNVAGGLALAEALDGVFWLLGPAEDGFGPELDRLLAGAKCHVSRLQCSIADAYATADVVTLPSTWEGFGNPTIESVVHRRPLAVGRYPVAEELRAFGFEWFDADDPASLRTWLKGSDRSLLDRNLAIARKHFNLASLSEQLQPLLT